MAYKVVEVTTKEQLDTLYKRSALTLEGLVLDSLPDFKGWLNKHHADTTNLEFWVTKGAVMNKHYKLTGDNAYPDDLNIVSCIGINPYRVTVERFAIGGRWFDDIVDNNLYREETKG